MSEEIEILRKINAVMIQMQHIQEEIKKLAVKEQEKVKQTILHLVVAQLQTIENGLETIWIVLEGVWGNSLEKKENDKTTTAISTREEV